MVELMLRCCHIICVQMEKGRRSAPKPAAIFALELVENLVDPEALKPSESIVEAVAFVVAQTADLVDGLTVTIIKLVDYLSDFFAFWRQVDANGTAVRAGALLENVAGLDELLEIVGDV